MHAQRSVFFGRDAGNDAFPYVSCVLLHDLHEHRLFALGGRGLHDRADRLCDATLLADDLAHIVGIDAQLDEVGTAPAAVILEPEKVTGDGCAVEEASS